MLFVQVMLVEVTIVLVFNRLYVHGLSDEGLEYITERQIADICAANIRRYKSQYPIRRNKSSLSELLVSFFDKVISSHDLLHESRCCCNMRHKKCTNFRFLGLSFFALTEPFILMLSVVLPNWNFMSGICHLHLYRRVAEN